MSAEETITRNTLQFERTGPVGHLILQRPDKLNAFTVEMWRELVELGAQLVEHPELRALVVMGSGRAFSSGIDTSVFVTGLDEAAGDESLASLPGRGTRHENRTVDMIMGVQAAYSWLAEAPFCTIAAVHGYAYGAGLQMAAACDLRVFARGAKVGLLELKYGILPDLGGTQRVSRLVGPGRAKELIFTGARIDADEAYRIGLCERIVNTEDLDATVTALAAEIAAQPPLAVRGAKRAVDRSFEVPIAEGLQFEAEQQAVCLRSDDMREAITAFVESRDPVYRGR